MSGQVAKWYLNGTSILKTYNFGFHITNANDASFNNIESTTIKLGNKNV